VITTRAVLVTPDNAITDIDLGRDVGQLQGHVGGYIEAVNSADGTVTFFCNEEGKILGLPPNHIATMVWWLLNPQMRGIDTLCGPVVITGGADPEGEVTDVPEVITVMLAAVREGQ
jgi:hypothetical protein